MIGAPVRIGAIRALPGGLLPSFELRDVLLQDAQQRPALRLQRVVVSISPRSLWRLGFEQLYIEAPDLEVRRDAAGTLFVGGLDVGNGAQGDHRAADWFFAQREFVVRHGTLRWTDELRGTAPPLQLRDVDLVVRNSARRHAIRLDATPPEGWGERFSLRARLRQPLLSVRSGDWKRWVGKVYAELPAVDVSRLGDYVALDAQLQSGAGALRAWADVREGEITAGTLDVALNRIDAVLAQGLDPLLLRNVTGRLNGSQSAQRQAFATQALKFETTDGLQWPGGNVEFERNLAQKRQPERGSFSADELDLTALALIAHRLPLAPALQQQLASHAPRGRVHRIGGDWTGPWEAPITYMARGRISGLALAGQPGQAAPPPPPPPAPAPAPNGKAPPKPVATAHVTPPMGQPGLEGASIVFEASDKGGHAELAITQGALEFPGVFEEPRVPIDTLSAKLNWTLQGDGAQLQVSALRFANADATGEATAQWRTSDPARSSSADRYPGVLDLQGQLTRADGTRVFRYLPQLIPAVTRHYVRDGVRAGKASQVDFRVRGDLHDMPFMDPRQGDFRIVAKVHDVTYAYVPPPAGVAPTASDWPALTGVSGELIFERAGMKVRGVQGRLEGAPGIVLRRGEAEIADMSHHAPVLLVDAQAQGPLDVFLRRTAPLLGGDGEAALGAMRAGGDAGYAFKMQLPLEAMEQVKVQATLSLSDNLLQPLAAAPPFTQLRGSVSFSETGFALAGVQGQLAGGDLRLEGRGRYGAKGSQMSFKAQGQLSAEGLRAQPEIAPLRQLGQQAQGSTGYSATLALQDGEADFSFNSSLQGLALDLPAPLGKAAGASLPLRIEKKLLPRATAGAPLQDQLALDVGHALSVRYLRDLDGDLPRVRAGAIAVGLAEDETAQLPAQGVQAQVQLERADFDAWRTLLARTAAPGAAPTAAEAASASDEALRALDAYLPTHVALRAQTLVVADRSLRNVVLGASHDGAIWRSNIEADELNGYVEYRQAQGGRLMARLASLKIAPSAASEVASLLDEQPRTLPALDIVIDDFELLGRHLGRAEIQAVNLGGARREWRLNKLDFRTPEAQFSAHGQWAALRGRGEAHQVTMRFKLQMSDVGALLERFNMKDVVRRGSGQLEGEVAWQGSPFALDYPSLTGQLHVDVASGQFLKADPGLAKLLGVLSLQALPRRLTLDFRDVFSDGFQFDFVRGDATIREGMARTNNLQMKGSSAAVLMDGSADIARETQQLRVVVVPELNAATAALVATAINPAVGLATFLAQAALGRTIGAAITQEFQIDGTWADPKITKVSRSLLPTTSGDAAKPSAKP